MFLFSSSHCVALMSPLGHFHTDKYYICLNSRFHSFSLADADRVWSLADLCESPDSETHPVWRRVDEGSVEAGGLRVEGQHQLVLTEQGLGVRLWVGLPLGKWYDSPSAERVPPDHTDKQLSATATRFL